MLPEKLVEHSGRRRLGCRIGHADSAVAYIQLVIWNVFEVRIVACLADQDAPDNVCQLDSLACLRDRRQKNLLAELCYMQAGRFPTGRSGKAQ